jgi:phage terminase large subunit-like protein
MSKEQSASSAPEKRWRPRSRKGPVCGYTLDGKACQKRGAHHCEQRASKVVAFFRELLVLPSGPWARQRFELRDWQENEIVRPLFGEVIWSTQWKRYVRRYRIAWIEIGRKQAKSTLAAGIALYLLVADDEDAAEVYGAARDTKQAGKVWEPAARMRQLSPVLAKRLGVNKAARRIFDEKTGSWYEIITADALGELGHNPHGFVLDEVLAQPSGSFWDTMRTAMGARAQPLMLAITTAGNDPSGFAKSMHDEMERVAEDPSRSPHIFAYLRNTPMDADPWDEANWYYANPALGQFFSLESLRQEALEARNDPTRENSFRQYHLNQWVSQVTRWIPLHLWDAEHRQIVEEDLHGQTCYAGLDLASTTDLAAWVLLFPHGPNEPLEVLWRFWTPEAQLAFLDRHTGGQASQWAKAGLLRTTEGDWIDYDTIHAQIEADKKNFRIVKVGYDAKEATATAQHMQKLGLDIDPVTQGFGLSGALKEMMRLVKAGQLNHGFHPVARWNADSAEVKRDDMERIKLVKPDRHASGKRIDGLAATGNAIHVWQLNEIEQESVYEERAALVL